MPSEPTVEALVSQLEQQAQWLWGETRPQLQVLQQTAEEIIAIKQLPLPPDLEPRFF